VELKFPGIVPQLAAVSEVKTGLAWIRLGTTFYSVE
jgi:hypothetical protein